MAQIFISHSSKDDEAAARLLEWLRERGFDQVFLDFDKDAGIQPGSDWERTLYAQLESCQAVLIILTKNWHASKWCFAEYFAARAQGKAIFPIIESPTGEMLVGSDLQAINFVSDRADGLERLSASLSEIALESAAGFDLPDDVSPFPGLNAFEAHHAAVFFGRDDVLVQLREVLRKRGTQGGERLIVLLGSSGSGKSSLLRAGLIPRLTRDRDNWIVLRAFRPEHDPLGKLIDTILQMCEGEERYGEWEQALDGDRPEEALRQIARHIRRKAKAADARILIAIDQGEELFQNLDDASRSKFFAFLSRMLAADLPFVAIIAMRSEFLDSLQLEKERTVAFDTFSVEPVPLSRIGAIIRGPARIANIRIDDDLIAAVTHDAGGADALPLVAFALRELYERFGSSGALTRQNYESLGQRDKGITPLENAVRLVVEEAFPKSRRTPEDDRLLRDAFIPELVQVSKDGHFVRRSAVYEELPQRVRPVIDKLVDARLLVRRSGSKRGASVVEVSHEAVFRVWPELAGWLEEERDFLIGRDRLHDALKDWEDVGRDSKALLRGVLLERAQDWLANYPERFFGAELAFIEQSIARDHEEKLRKKRAERRLFAAAVAAAIVFAILAVWGKISSDRAVEAEAQTKAQLLQALKNQSLHLASLSRQQTAQGDPVTGMLLALAALPGDSDFPDRPYQPQAEEALARALRERREMLVATGHEKRIYRAVFSPDGTRFLTGSADRSARLWDAQTGALIKSYQGHLKGVTSVAFSADAARIYTGSLDGTIRIWDTETAEVTRTLEGRGTSPCMVRAITVRADDLRLAAGCSDGTVRLFDLVNGMQIRLYKQHRGRVSSVAFSPDGARLVSASHDGSLVVWEIASSEPRPFPRGHTAAVEWTAYSPDGSLIASASADGTAILWDAATLEPVQTFEGHENAVASVAFDDGGTRLVTGSLDRTIRIWDVSSAAQTAVLRGHQAAVWTVAVSPDGGRILSGGSDFTARLWDARRQPHLGATLSGHDGAINQAAFDGTGERIVTASTDGTARLWSATTGELLARFQHGDFEVTSAAFSPDGTHVATGSGDGRVRLWSSEAPDRALTLDGEAGQIFAVAFSPDGERLVAGANDGVARVWRTDTGGQILVLPGHAGAVLSVAFDGAGKRIATGTIGGDLIVWDAASGKQQHRLDAGGADVNSVAFSADGRLLAAGLSDRTVRLYDTETGAAREAALVGHLNEVTSVRFSAKGGRIYSASSDGTVRVWSVADGSLITEIPSSAGPVSSLDVSGGETARIAAASGNTVSIWRIFETTEALVARARAAVPRCLTEDQRRAFVIADAALGWCKE